jgi:hypothetical protein
MFSAVRRRATLAVATSVLTTALLGTAFAQASGPVQLSPPRLKLVAAQRTVHVQSSAHDQVYLDPGIWVTAYQALFRLNVDLPRYGGLKVVTQVIQTRDGGTVTRRLPGGLLDGWNGMKNFIQLTVRDAHGTVKASQQVGFCPDSSDPERTVDTGPFNDPYPYSCSAFDPFTKGSVWGLPRG